MQDLTSIATSPGKPSLAGAGLFAAQTPGSQAPQLPIHPVDSTVDVRPLGDTITPIIQFIFQQHPWVMWGGVALAAVIALFLLRWLWPRRQAMLTWLATRNRAVKIAMAGAIGILLLAATGAGFAGYHFMENDPRFCNGCHIFVPSGQAWVRPDTGWYSLVPKLEGKHDTINCHTCHPLKPIKEGIKLTLWMSGVRDEHIPEHAKVPRATCEQCHVQGAARETWQAVAATAGHRTHLESDSSALKGKVECLTCHARTAHRFQPADTTCVQQGCHLTEESRIQLGRMAGQSDLHCILCHQFTLPVVALATRDSAAGTLRPNLDQCLSCHQMRGLVPGFRAERDPHNGTCGMCHNPHAQTTVAAAATSCSAAGCHADWRSEPFHTGLTHRNVAQNCALCHQPHAARVDASDCTGCHDEVRSRPGSHPRPPAVFDTAATLRQSLAPPTHEPQLEQPGKVKGDSPPAAEAPLERPSKVKGDAPPLDDPPWGPSTLHPLPSDTFSHPRHQKLACLTCHVTTSREARLTFEAPRGCQICHHEGPGKDQCATCHETGELAAASPVPVTITIRDTPARERPVGFRHETHRAVQCQDCHQEQVSLTATDSVASCQGCHVPHHETGRDCAACHRTEAITTAHARPVTAHEGCDACHTSARIQSLLPARSFCLACHGAETDHYAPRECTTCHLQAHPEEWRPRLAGARAR
jgi:hypothetical protein